MGTVTSIDLSRPRTIGEIVDLATSVHLRRPLLFLVLALSVVGPYTLIVLAATGSSPLGESDASTQTLLVLGMVGVALVGPMVSVLHIQALSLLGDGIIPTFREVYLRAAPVIAVAAAAQIVAGIAIFLGILAFVVPGVIVAVRLCVVAQEAAIARTDWIGAVRGSFELTRGRGLHALGAVLVAGIFQYALTQAGAAVAGSHTHVQQVVLAIAVITIGQSFAAAITAVLYYDLRARQAVAG